MLTRDEIKQLTGETTKLIASGMVGAPPLSAKNLARCRELLLEEEAGATNGSSPASP